MNSTQSTVVACCQLAPKIGDLAYNRKLTERAIRSAVYQGAQVVVLPELVQSGYLFADRSEALSLAETVEGPTVRLWAALAGADLLCAPVNWPDGPRPLTERPAEVVRVQANASVNRMFIAACDRHGHERGVSWVQGSVIVDADGYPVAGPAEQGGEQILLATLNLAEARNKRISARNDLHRDRRSQLYG
ncbi:nitrilase-related carbon-nitrogen hydrolase [Pseudomonas sp. Ma2-10]